MTIFCRTPPRGRCCTAGRRICGGAMRCAGGRPHFPWPLCTCFSSSSFSWRRHARIACVPLARCSTSVPRHAVPHASGAGGSRVCTRLQPSSHRRRIAILSERTLRHRPIRRRPCRPFHRRRPCRYPRVLAVGVCVGTRGAYEPSPPARRRGHVCVSSQFSPRAARRGPFC